MNAMPDYRIIEDENQTITLHDGTLVIANIPSSTSESAEFVTVAAIKEGDTFRPLTETEAGLVTTLWDAYFTSNEEQAAND